MPSASGTHKFKYQASTEKYALMRLDSASMLIRSASAKDLITLLLVKLSTDASTITHQRSQPTPWIDALTSSNGTMREMLLTPVLPPTSSDARLMTDASGTNAGLTSEAKMLHAVMTPYHIASKPTDNSTQVLAVLTRLNKSSASQLLMRTSRTEINFSLVSSPTLKTHVPWTKHADGKERRLFATILQDGAPSDKVFPAASSPKDIVSMEQSRSNTSSMPLLNSTTQPTTAALVVNQFSKRPPNQPYQSTHWLPTTSVNH